MVRHDQGTDRSVRSSRASGEPTTRCTMSHAPGRHARTRPMKTRLRFALFAAVVAYASTARADTIQASSTTLLIGRQDYRDGNVQTAIPVYEILDLAATDVKTPYTDTLEIALSTWGHSGFGSAGPGNVNTAWGGSVSSTGFTL